MSTIEVMRKALEALEHPQAGLVPHQGEWRSRTSLAIDALRAELERLDAVEPVAWLYTLEYGSATAGTKVSLHQLRYPFGVCGADYLRCNDDGTSYVRETPLYAANKAQDMSEESTQAWEAAIPDGRATDQWDSGRVYDYNVGWNDCREAVKAALPKLYTAPIAPSIPAPTHEQIDEGWIQCGGSGSAYDAWHDGARWAYDLAAKRAGAQVKGVSE